MRLILLILGVVALVSMSACTTSLSGPQASAENSIRVYVSDEADGEGIWVKLISPVYTSGPKRGEVVLQIANLTENEVFVEVTGFDNLGYSFWSTGETSPERTEDGKFTASLGGRSSGGGSHIVSPNNTHLLKRLHAAKYDGKKLVNCYCGAAQVTGKISYSGDLNEWLDADKTTVMVPINGYVRGSNQSFHESIDIPITLKKGQQEPSRSPGKPAL